MSKVEPTYPDMTYVDTILGDVEDTEIYEWGDIIELTDKSVGQFPNGKFPQWIEDFVHQVSHAVQSPKDMSYALAIGVLSISLTGKFRVNLSNVQSVSLNTYTAIIADSGERKSATFTPFLEPVEAFETQLQKDTQEKISRRASFRKALEIQRSVVEKQMNSEYNKKDGADKNKIDKLSEELAHIIQELSDHPPIVKPLITIGDTTPEKFGRILYDQGEKVSITSSESTFFSDFAGAYNSTPRQEIILSAYSGDAYKASRVNEQSDGIDLKEPHANVLVMVQPTVLENVNEALKGRGLLNRFFYYKPTSMVGYREIEDRDIDKGVKSRYFNNIYQMLELSQRDESLKLSKGAKQIYQSFGKNTEQDLREGNDLHDIQGWGNRLPTSVIKIAGLMHIAEYAGELSKLPDEISADTMMNAIDLASYMIHQTKSITQLMEVNEVDKIAKNFVIKLTTSDKFKGKSDIAARDLKGSVNWQGNADGAIKNEALRILSDHNYIRLYKGGKLGTKDMIAVNPALLGDT